MLNILISAFIFLFSCLMYLKSKAIPGGTRWDLVGARFFPRMMLVFMGVISLIILFFSIKNYFWLRRKSTKEKQFFLYEYKEVITIFLLMFLYIAGFKIFGFFLISIIFLTFLQWYLNKGSFSYKNLLIFLLISVISVTVINFVFSRYLHVLFPTGFLEIEF